MKRQALSLALGLVLGSAFLAWSVGPVPFQSIFLRDLTANRLVRVDSNKETADSLLADDGTNVSLPTGVLILGGNATQSGELRILEDTDDGSNYTSFKVPALSANVAYTLPADDGDSSEVLSTDGSGVLSWEAGGSGSAITLDLGDDGGDDSTDLTEIAVTGDTNSIFTEPSADKLLIAVANNWPTADSADAVGTDAVAEIADIASAIKSGADATLVTGTAGTSGNCVEWNADGDVVDSGGTCGGGGGGGSAFFHAWTANQTIGAGTGTLATPDTRNGHPVLDFDAAADECSYFEGILDPSYDGGGLTFTVYWMATSATSGATGWLLAIERQDDDAVDLDADSFAADNSVSATTATASGEVDYATIAFTDGADMDSLAAGESFRARLCRDGDGSVVTDSMTGDAELFKLSYRETP